MKKLGGKLRHKIAVFISGRGSNLKSIIKSSSKKNTSYKVCLVISNEKKAKGLIIAKKNKIKCYFKNFTKSKKIGNAVLNLLKKNNIKLICLAGFMKILPPYFIKSYNGKIINIHPSLLPKYKGLDSGKIISQKKIRIKKKDNAKSIEKKVLKIEHKIYPQAINKVLSNL